MKTLEATLARIRGQRERYEQELIEFLRFPSISTAPEHSQDLLACVQHLKMRCEEAGLTNCTIHPTPRHPILTAEWRGAPGAPTVLVYGHYDVQPVDPLDLWDSPPFEPVIRNGKLIARGSADDKGQLYIHVKAVEALLAENGTLPVNIVMLFEGEEEIGSPNLEAFIHAHKDLLKCDVALISDTAMFGEGLPSICTALKGLAYLEMRLTGPNRDLHSGEFGGPVRNPANVLCELLSSLWDTQGRVAVEGFYDPVRNLDTEERAEVARLPFNETEYMADLDVDGLRPEPGWTVIEHLGARPTIDVNGIWGGFAGEGAKTVLPSKAGAKFSFRLVANQDHQQVSEAVVAHLKARIPAGIKAEFINHHGGSAAEVPIDHPAVLCGADAMEQVFGRRPFFQREGGSIPIVATFDRVLDVKTVLLGFSLPDCRIHSPNENMDLPNFHRGIETIARFLDLLPSRMQAKA
ncbi:MAG: dipeptidase [Candidatus Cloacimonetes bacterium]|nr:dipeptidase [Candidatus Cloacimonadota bacterium]